MNSFIYNIQDPLGKLYTKVQDLKELATAASNPYSATQLINFGLDAIKRTHDFEIAQSEWHAKDAHLKTWPNFKTHFSAARRNLQMVRGPTIHQAGFHQV